MRIFSIFIDNLPIDLDNLGLKKLFGSFGEVVDVYILNKVGRKSDWKYGFVIFGEFNHGKSEIEALNGESVNGHKLEVAWAKFQKGTSSKPSKQREEPQKKMVWKWILKKKLTSIPNEAPKALENNQQLASPCKQALLSYPNSTSQKPLMVILRLRGMVFMMVFRIIARQLLNPWMVLIIDWFLLKSSLLRHQLTDLQWKMMGRLTVPYACLIMPSRWTFNFMKKGRWLNIVTKVRIVATGTQGQLMIRPSLLK